MLCPDPTLPGKVADELNRSHTLGLALETGSLGIEPEMDGCWLRLRVEHAAVGVAATRALRKAGYAVVGAGAWLSVTDAKTVAEINRSSGRHRSQKSGATDGQNPGR